MDATWSTSSESSTSSPMRKGNRMELHRLSIAEKPRLSQEMESPPRKNGGINLSLDLKQSTTTDGCASDGSGNYEDEQLLYALASKKRHISELEQELKIARRDLSGLEEQWKHRAASKQPTSSLQNWHNRLQRSVENGGFLQNIVHKFNEFTQTDVHDDEAEFDKLQDRQQEGFYLKNKLDYDDDEEVEDEETGGTLVGQEKWFCR